MTGRRWTTVAIAGTLSVAVVGSGLFWILKSGSRGGSANPASADSAKSPMKLLAQGLRRGDAEALAALCQRVLVKAERPTAVGDDEAADMIEVLEGLRVGFLKYAPVGRASAIAAVTHILDRFQVEPCPSNWVWTLQPVHDLFTAGMADPHVDVRSSALMEVGRYWGWLPGRTMTPAEENGLAERKDGLHAPALRCLSDVTPKSRAAAVVCIGALPIDSMAAPAVANVEYPENGGVRYKALMTFASRPALLPVDMVLKRLHDSEPGVPELAELILKGRRLTKEQIFLGRQIFNPHPEIRLSVIPLIRGRTDIDPDVWLLQLSHDTDETVRAKTVEALIGRESAEVDKRLREMALSDTSAAIRAAANKHVAKSDGATTAQLPPLPGSPSLNPKAN